jgi:hypothetical protein
VGPKRGLVAGHVCVADGAASYVQPRESEEVGKRVNAISVFSEPFALRSGGHTFFSMC